jgi:hypothetical protein
VQGVTGFTGLFIMTIVPQVNKHFDGRMLWALFIVITILEPIAGEWVGRGCKKKGGGFRGAAVLARTQHEVACSRTSMLVYEMHTPSPSQLTTPRTHVLFRWGNDQGLAACAGHAAGGGQRPGMHVLYLPLQWADLRVPPTKGRRAEGLCSATRVYVPLCGLFFLEERCYLFFLQCPEQCSCATALCTLPMHLQYIIMSISLSVVSGIWGACAVRFPKFFCTW